MGWHAHNKALHIYLNVFIYIYCLNATCLCDYHLNGFMEIGALGHNHVRLHVAGNPKTRRRLVQSYYLIENIYQV